MFRTNDILEALHALGTLLEERGVSYSAIVLGGANLLVQGITNRPTIDIDVVAQMNAAGIIEPALPLPVNVADAVNVIAQIRLLPSDWFNSMAGSEFSLGFPEKFETRLHPQSFAGLRVWWVARFDMVAWKLLAAVDRYYEVPNKHLEDLKIMVPTIEELEHARKWFNQVTAPTSAAHNYLPKVLEALSDDR